MLALFLLRYNSLFRNLVQHLQNLFLDRANVGLDLFQGPPRCVAGEVPIEVDLITNETNSVILLEKVKKE
jgi:hypothetical protein